MPLDQVTEEVLAGGWHWIGHVSEFGRRVTPVVLLPGALDEPLLVVRGEDDGGWLALSNVCTHRGAVVVERACDERRLVCPYHGRRFGFDGRLVAAPGFDGVDGFPTAADDLRRVALGVWRGLLFASVVPSVQFEDWIAPIAERCGHLPWDELEYAPDRSRDHVVEADWRIYCENYLEGFHIPYVHPELARTVALDRYTTEPQGHACLQLARARDGDDALRSGDRVVHIAAWYWFLFPGTMLNAYPWGVSVNAVEPSRG